MKNLLIVTLGTAFLLGACSGGGGNGNNGGNGGNGGNSATARISGANALSVARVSYDAALASAGVGDLSSSTGLTAAMPGGVSKMGSSFEAANHSSDGSLRIPVPPTTELCIPSGSMTISGDIADPFTPTLTRNDYFDIEFDMCNDGATVTDGNLHYVVDAFSGDFLGGLYELVMDTTLTTFQVSTGDDVLTSSGVALVRLDTRQSPMITVEVAGTSLTIDKNASSETQTNFSSTHMQDLGTFPSPYTLTSSGSLDSTQLSGRVQYSTPVTFAGFDADYPGSGELLVSGDNSNVRLIAIDNVNVRLEVDSNGDGNVDETINTTWVELHNN